MNVLGIETSCDETSASVVQDGRLILSNVVISSLKEHSKYGGIIPEIASRRQLECIQPIVEESLEKAGLSLKDIDAVAVTSRPGLIGSLLVGISYARALSFSIQKPLVEIDHIQAHLYANFLQFNDPKNRLNKFLAPKLPAVGLIVSGGHTTLYHLKSFKNFKIIGQTRDDAAGEAFDKVAKVLNLGYPGGPIIDKLAKESPATKLKFNYADIPQSFDFSFSGVKTAVLYYDRDHKKNPQYNLAEVAGAFQKSVVDILVKKCIEACQKYKTKTLLIGGGVAANSSLRETLLKTGGEQGLNVYFPPMSLCLDNAAMIAGLGYHYLKK